VINGTTYYPEVVTTLGDGSRLQMGKLDFNFRINPLILEKKKAGKK